MSTGLRINEVAERTGFSRATLRYYEGIGLLPAARRSAAGYRIYDDRAIERLAFIARAKQLGCSLDEIADLTTAWDGGRCGPVQDHMRTLVADKIAGAQTQITELLALTADLQQAAAALEQHRPDGPCDDRCGCVADPGPQPVAIACTLPAQRMPGRLDDWRALLATATGREPIDGGVRVRFAPSTPIEHLARLAAAERDCCRFFRFALVIDERGTALEVTAPLDAQAIVQSLFGAGHE